MILAWTFLAVSLASATIQGVALVRMLGSGPARSDPVRRGLLRTSSCRVLAALAYVALAIVSLLNLVAASAAVATFAAVQLMWIVNGLLDVRLRRRLDPLISARHAAPASKRLRRDPSRPLKEKLLSPKLADLIERVAWTFLQALAGAITAASAAASFNTFDWRAALIGGGTAAVICAIKVLLGQTLNAGAQPAVVDMARNVLLDLIDELFPKAAPEVAAVRAGTAPAPAVQSPVTKTVSAPAAVPTVTVASPPAPVVPAFAQAPIPAPVAAVAPVAVPPSAADIAALSAQQSTP